MTNGYICILKLAWARVAGQLKVAVDGLSPQVFVFVCFLVVCGPKEAHMVFTRFLIFNYDQSIANMILFPLYSK